MPKLAKEMKPASVAALKHDGGKGHAFHAVGGVSGLLLQVTAGGGRSWIMRIRIAGDRKHFGLGSYPEVSLAEARRRASDVRDAVRNGAAPIEAWRIGAAARDLLSKGFSSSDAWMGAREQRAAQVAGATASRDVMTFTVAMEKYLKTGRITSLQSETHRKQWKSTLETYAIPVIGKMRVGEITKVNIIEILAPIWNDKRETASRLRGRIESVLDSEAARKYRLGENPASNAVLKNWISEQGKATKSNQPALALDDAQAWWKMLRKRDGMSARAVEFLTLCASRSGEVRGAKWDEFTDLDGESPLWVISAERMKAHREHRVALSPDAVALLDALPRLEGSPYVFPAVRGGMLSDMSLSAVMRRMQEAENALGRKGWLDRVNKRPAVPHGLRSTFRDWAAERTDYPRDMAEIALAHSVGSEVERAYRRGDMIEKRRVMMVDWAAFLNG